MTAFTNFLKFPDISTLNRLHVMGILANGVDIGPKGVHLRWMFPPSAGIPKSTNIYRRPHEKSDARHVNGLKKNELLTAGKNHNGIVFTGFKTGTLKSESNAGELRNLDKSQPFRLVISFLRPVSNLKISLINPNSETKGSAFRNGENIENQTALKSTTSKAKTFLNFNGIDIDHVSVELTFDMLTDVEFIDPAVICKDTNWESIGSCVSFSPDQVGLEQYLTSLVNDSNTFNYYLSRNATQRNSAKTHYKNSAIELLRLFDWLKNPGDPSVGEVFENPGADLANLQFISRNDKPFNNLKPIGLITMAAQDPNLATMLGLYFVDKTMNSLKRYDYKVECTYSGKPSLCGIVMDLGNEMYSSVPSQTPVFAKESSGKTWVYSNLIDNQKLEGGIGLKWARPAIDPGNSSQRFNEPVLFAVKRDPVFKARLQGTNPEDKLVAVHENNYLNPSLNCFTDTKLTRLDSGNYKYEVAPVTIFGQKGPSVFSDPINISDVMPVPPVALSVQEVKPLGQPLKQKLRFKFGAAQFFVAPHTKRFQILSRPDSLIDKQHFGYTLAVFNGKNHTSTLQGDKIFTLNISRDDVFPSTLGMAAGDLNVTVSKPYHTAEFSLSADKTPLPTSRIKKFTINRFLAKDKIEIVVDHAAHPTYEIPASGFVVLIKDPHSASAPNNWKSSALTVNLVPPKKLVLLTARTVSAGTSPGFNCTITKVKTIAPVRDRISGNLITPVFTELFFNRALLEQGLFDGGTITVGGTQKQILYQGGGLASAATTPDTELATDVQKGRFARIMVTGAFPQAVPGANMVLQPRVNTGPVPGIINPLTGLFVLKFSTPASGTPVGFGEVLLKVRQKLQVASDRTKDQILPVSLPTLSDFSPVTGGVEVLVKINKEVNSLTPDLVNHGAFFGQYEVDVTAIITAQPIPANAPATSTFFAIQSETDGNVPFNRSMLSSPAQYYKANLVVPEAPGRPNPCVMPAAGEKAFLPPPDMKGYAVNCISWPALPNIRYEVYRTLDATLLLQHKNEFLKGNSVAVSGLTMPGSLTLSMQGALTRETNTGFLTGTYITPAMSVTGENVFLNSRLEISSVRMKNYYQIVSAKMASPNFTAGVPQSVKVKLTMKPVNAGFNIALNSGIHKLTFLPDYKLVAKNETVLAALANKPALEKAYSLVSGVPVRVGTFNDMVPARGINMFFYKTRAINASEVKSAFSAASMPVFQMDTTPPDEIRELSACSIDNRAMLMWKKDISGETKAYKLIREIVPAGGGPVIKTETELPLSALLSKPCFLTNASTIVLNTPLAIPFPSSLPNQSGTLPNSEATKAVIRAVVVKEIINATTKTLIKSDQYEINYTINTALKLFVVSSIQFHQKRDAGIFFEISVNNLPLMVEKDYLSYIDSAVNTGDSVKYTVIPVNLAGPAPQVRIPGRPSGLSAVEIKDYRKPDVRIDLTFIKPDASISAIFDKTAKGKFTITQVNNELQVKIESKIPGSAGFGLSSISELRDGLLSIPQKGWISLTPSASGIVLLDQNRYAETAVNVVYKITVRSKEEVQADLITITK